MIDRLSAWVVLGVALFCAAPVNAQHIEPFEHGWTLETASSEIRFLSVKNGSITEMHRFDSFAGSIDADGVVQLTVPLDSVNTGIDLRNVRMRFMFFETFLFPEATVTASLDAGQLINLPKERRKRLALPFKISLHGIELDLGTEVTVTLIDKDRVSVASSTPMTLPLAPFGLDTGLTKLEEAGQVDIVPVAITSFDLIFARNASGFVNPVTVPEVQSPDPAPEPDPLPIVAGANDVEAATTQPASDETATTQPTVTEVTAGATGLAADATPEQCAAKVAETSAARPFDFAPSSATLESSATPYLEQLYGVMTGCADLRIKITGHTDSFGGAQANKRLSEWRAGAVANYLLERDVARDRLQIVGMGEASPIAPNNTAQNRAVNRRIEVQVLP